MATRAQIEAARRNIKKAQAARRAMLRGRVRRRPRRRRTLAV